MRQNPAQYYNSTANYAFRYVYFFVVKNSDGSVSLQVGPPPFAEQDTSIVNSGIAIIDCNTVVQNYTAEEVASLENVDITFTVTAHPNIALADGYNMNAVLSLGAFNLDPQSINFYELQGIEISSYGLSGLYNVELNSNNGVFSVFFDAQDTVKWVSPENGLLLSKTQTDQAYFTTTKGNDPSSQSFTFRVDFSQISELAAATYNTLMVFRMFEIPSDRTFLEELNYYSTIQQVQVNYLYSSVLVTNSYLIGNNALYRPLPEDQAILQTHRTMLITEYNQTLDAMQVQWDAFNSQSNLTPDEQTLILQMLEYIQLARSLSSNFDLT